MKLSVEIKCTFEIVTDRTDTTTKLDVPESSALGKVNILLIYNVYQIFLTDERMACKIKTDQTSY